MQCPAQQYAFEILKEYPLDKWRKYRDCVYLLELSNDKNIILLGNYGYVPIAYDSWVKKGCSDVAFEFSLNMQISLLQEKNEAPTLKKINNSIFNV